MSTDLSVKIAGVTFKNPLIAASGTYGFGGEYDSLYPLETFGGISVKGLTPKPREGNPPSRIAETPSGMLNSVGLQNPGVDAFIQNELPRLQKRDIVVIANIAGSTVEDYIEIAEKIGRSGVPMAELNISCPNVKKGGAAFGVSCQSAAQVTKAVRDVLKIPLIVKLSPNVTDIAEIAKAVEQEGADAISLINTVLGMRIDIATKRPVLYNNVGGLSGPAVFPIALRMVWQTARAVNIPVIGLGGIAKWQDAVEMMMAGATAVQIGSAMFHDPLCPVNILQGLQQYAELEGLKSITELKGSVIPWGI